MILGCIDGGIFCVPLMLLTAVGLGWCVKCIRKHFCKNSCDCSCHKEQDNVEEE